MFSSVGMSESRSWPSIGSDVVEAELLEQRGRHHHALGLLLQPLGQFKQRRRIAQHLLAHVLGRRVELPAHELGQVAVERAHRGRDRHVVVVQHHQQPALGHTGVVQGLEGHAGRHGAVADDGHGVAFIALDLGGQRHAQRRRDAGRRVRGAEGVVFAFVAARETADAVQLAQRVHAVAPAGEDFVGVGLVAHIPDQPVFGCVEHVVQRHGELHRAQIGAEVTTGARHALQQETAQLVGQRRQLLAREAAQIGGRVDGGKQGTHVAVSGVQWVRRPTQSVRACRGETRGNPVATKAWCACSSNRSA